MPEIKLKINRDKLLANIKQRMAGQPLKTTDGCSGCAGNCGDCFKHLAVGTYPWGKVDSTCAGNCKCRCPCQDCGDGCCPKLYVARKPNLDSINYDCALHYEFGFDVPKYGFCNFTDDSPKDHNNPQCPVPNDCSIGCWGWSSCWGSFSAECNVAGNSAIYTVSGWVACTTGPGGVPCDGKHPFGPDNDYMICHMTGSGTAYPPLYCPPNFDLSPIGQEGDGCDKFGTYTVMGDVDIGCECYVWPCSPGPTPGPTKNTGNIQDRLAEMAMAYGSLAFREPIISSMDGIK